jgi:hypothetical protein
MKKHFSENFRLITPLISIFNGVLLTIVSFFFIDFYQEQKKQGSDLQLIKQKLSFLEGKLNIKFDTSNNAISFTKTKPKDIYETN